jgi:hypothetical protein
MRWYLDEKKWELYRCSNSKVCERDVCGRQTIWKVSGIGT